MSTTIIDADDENIILASDTLAGDIRDFILDRLKHEHNALPWNMRPEQEQRETIERATAAARHLVHRACLMIAAGTSPAIRAQLAKLQVKDGIQAQVNVASSDPLRHELMDRVGSTVLLLITRPEEHMGERGEVPVSKDQPDMLDEPQDDVE